MSIVKRFFFPFLRLMCSWFVSDILSLIEYIIVIAPLLLMSFLSINAVYKIPLSLLIILGLGCKFDRWHRHR